jgi:pyruvate dehydrogenase E1 component
LLASGSAMLAAQAAQQTLAAEWGVAADLWSATSWNELHRDGVACEEHNLLHPDEPAAVPHVTKTLSADVPVVAVSDFQRAVPDLISRWVPGDYTSLGTDGFGRSDTRAALRRWFRVDSASITLAALEQLARRGELPAKMVKEAMDRYAFASTSPDPASATEADAAPVSD